MQAFGVTDSLFIKQSLGKNYQVKDFRFSLKTPQLVLHA